MIQIYMIKPEVKLIGGVISLRSFWRKWNFVSGYKISCKLFWFKSSNNFWHDTSVSYISSNWQIREAARLGSLSGPYFSYDTKLFYSTHVHQPQKSKGWRKLRHFLSVIVIKLIFAIKVLLKKISIIFTFLLKCLIKVTKNLE